MHSRPCYCRQGTRIFIVLYCIVGLLTVQISKVSCTDIFWQSFHRRVVRCVGDRWWRRERWVIWRSGLGTGRTTKARCIETSTGTRPSTTTRRTLQAVSCTTSSCTPYSAAPCAWPGASATFWRSSSSGATRSRRPRHSSSRCESLLLVSFGYTLTRLCDRLLQVRDHPING